MAKGKTAILLILDGFGYSETSTSNAIEQANMPVWDRLCTESERSRGAVGVLAMP